MQGGRTEEESSIPLHTAQQRSIHSTKVPSQSNHMEEKEERSRKSQKVARKRKKRDQQTERQTEGN